MQTETTPAQRRGLRIAAWGWAIGMVGLLLAFFDPTPAGGPRGMLFYSGFGIAILAIVIFTIGLIMHVVILLERRSR